MPEIHKQFSYTDESNKVLQDPREDNWVGDFNTVTTRKKMIVGTAREQFSADPNGEVNFGTNWLVTKSDVMTYSATISLDVTKASLHITTTTAAVGNATINASNGGIAGQVMRILITNDATAGRTITFNTNFKPNATLVGTVSKSAVVSFVSDGTNFYEYARQTGL